MKKYKVIIDGKIQYIEGFDKLRKLKPQRDYCCTKKYGEIWLTQEQIYQLGYGVDNGKNYVKSQENQKD